MTTPPPVIAAYFDAGNRADRQHFLATFAEDALVDDVRRQFRGKAAIADWAEREIFAVNVSMAIMRTEERRDGQIVDVKLDGTFPKAGLPDPLVMTFDFTIENDKIAKLFIALKKPAGSKSV